MSSCRYPHCGRKGWHWYRGEVIPGESITKVLHEKDRLRTLLSSDCSLIKIVEESVQQQCVIDYMVVVSIAMAELMKEDEEEEDEEESMEEGVGKGMGEGVGEGMG